jgi:hypothetical protein
VRRLAIALAGTAVLGLAAWQGAAAWQAGPSPAGNGAAIVSEVGEGAALPQPGPSGRTAALAGETPMAERTAVLGLLNKRNGLWRDLALRPGQALRVGRVVVRLRACETTADWEAERLTGAFVQLFVQNREGDWRKPFSGWLYKESPGLNVVEDPVYDVWVKSCTMTHPATGPQTVSAVVAPSRSSTKKSPAAAAPDAGSPPETAPASAASSSDL